MTEVIPVTCPFCNSGLEKLENLVIIVDGIPQIGWQCSCCKKSFSINHPMVREIIQKTLNKNFRQKKQRRQRKEEFRNYRTLQESGNVGMGVMT